MWDTIAPIMASLQNTVVVCATCERTGQEKYLIWTNEISRDLLWILEGCPLWQQPQVDKACRDAIVLHWKWMLLNRDRQEAKLVIKSCRLVHTMLMICIEFAITMSPCTNNIKKAPCETFATDLRLTDIKISRHYRNRCQTIIGEVCNSPGCNFIRNPQICTLDMTWNH